MIEFIRIREVPTVPGDQKVALVVRRQGQVQSVAGSGWHQSLPHVRLHDLGDRRLDWYQRNASDEIQPVWATIARTVAKLIDNDLTRHQQVALGGAIHHSRVHSPARRFPVSSASRGRNSGSSFRRKRGASSYTHRIRDRGFGGKDRGFPGRMGPWRHVKLEVSGEYTGGPPPAMAFLDEPEDPLRRCRAFRVPYRAERAGPPWLSRPKVGRASRGSWPTDHPA